MERINFHDSHIESSIHNDDNLTIHFDWAGIQDYATVGHVTDIVVGKCSLVLSGVTSTVFLKHDNPIYTKREPGPPQPHVPVDIKEGFILISLNTFDSTESGQILTLGGVYDGIEGVYWLEQIIHFRTGRFNWNNHVTVEEWQAGAVTQ
ncbi:hypothetical protein [Hymenobacter psychrotolerans]|uniref:hypothetical protein n=1 Tax=Hymenobacter psychrotolerans TaxID=344998 RepID=UPI001114EDEE|nr:hypothetical protein [Hymenobacter psychrotolerans]